MDADLKLDFKDVLFRPKRSSLKSRSEVGAARITSATNSQPSGCLATGNNVLSDACRKCLSPASTETRYLLLHRQSIMRSPVIEFISIMESSMDVS